MEKENIKKLKIPEIKNVFSDLLKQNKDAFKTPNLGPLPVDYKEQTLVEIQKEISEIKKNSKKSFWIGILQTVIGGIIVLLISYFIGPFFPSK